MIEKYRYQQSAHIFMQTVKSYDFRLPNLENGRDNSAQASRWYCICIQLLFLWQALSDTVRLAEVVE
jgi:hypothetical protein